MLDFVDQTAKSHTGPLKDFRNIFMNLDVLFDKLFQGALLSHFHVLLFSLVVLAWNQLTDTCGGLVVLHPQAARSATATRTYC